MAKRKILALLCAMVMLIAAFAGCGNTPADSASAAGGDVSTTTQPQEAENVAAADEGLGSEYLRDRIIMSQSSDGGTFNPYAHSNFTATTLIFQTLIRQDLNGDIRYEMAKSVDKVDDLNYTIVIWDNIYDSEGNHITASDVVFSIDTLITAGNESQVSKLDHLEIVDDYTLTWVCKEPFGIGDLEKQMSDPCIVSQAAYESHDFSVDPIGSGPYVLTEYVPGSSVTVVANEDFWMKDLPDDIKANLWTYSAQNVREIYFPIIPDAATRAIALETGEIDIADALDGSDAAAFAQRDEMNAINAPVDPPAAFIFNCSDESPLADVNLRMAICYALDNQAIVDGANFPANRVWGISPRMYDAPESWRTGKNADGSDLDYYDYDPELAREYLEKSNYNGEELVLMYTSSAAADHLALTMQSQLRDYGINIKLYCVEQSVIMTARPDPTAWDMRIDEMGGGNYFGKIAYKWTSMDSINTLHGLTLLMVEDQKLDELSDAVYSGATPENIEEWNQYFTYEKCYAYAVFGYSNQTACRAGITPGFGKRYAILPNACTFE